MRNLQLGKHKSLRAFLRALPSFCWQTNHEILLMLEQVYEDIDAVTVNQTIFLLARTGQIDREICLALGRAGKRKEQFKYKGKG